MSEEIVTKQLKGELTVSNKIINYQDANYFGASFKIKI